MDCFWNFIYDYQTLIAGLFAIFAAVITVIGALHAANVSISATKKEQEDILKRKKKYAEIKLSEEFKILAERARMAEGTIKVVINANSNVTDSIRDRTILISPGLVEEWEFMSLFDKKTFNEILTLRQRVFQHNFDMQRAGGSFGDDNFKSSILVRIKEIQERADAISINLK